jgi:2,3-bisphosphoglycerate-independent phosphoglycerate mutase
LKKVLLVLLDSAAPLEAADKPFLDEIAQKGETGLLETGGAELAREARQAGFVETPADGVLAALEEHEAVVTRLAAESTQAVEELDRTFFGPLVKSLRLPDFVIAVAGGTGSGPVPLLITSDGLEPEGALEFGETEAAHGRLGKLRGSELVSRLVQIAES